MRNILRDLGIGVDDPATLAVLRDAIYAGQHVASMRATRLMRGLTTQQVAERMGTAETDVVEIELPGADPHMSTLRRYALAVGVVTHYGVTEIPEPDESQEATR